jgi:hypothetical protein
MDADEFDRCSAIASERRSYGAIIQGGGDIKTDLMVEGNSHGPQRVYKRGSRVVDDGLAR